MPEIPERLREGTEVRWSKTDRSIRFGMVVADGDGAPEALSSKVIVAVRDDSGEWPLVAVDRAEVKVIT